KAVRVSDTSDTSGLAGYDKIALAVVRAIHFNSNAVMPLNVSNRGTVRGLADAARQRDRGELLVHAAGREAALPGRRAARPRRSPRLRARQQPRRPPRHAGAASLL